jgi:transcriptional regulator with XRE-family HTH domain
MKNRLKEHRTHGNLTQEELANLSGISIRTIQRIENQQSTFSAYTAKTLAKVLEINSSDLIESGHASSTPEDNKLELLNLSTFTVWLIPFGNIITPAIIFFKFRNTASIKLVGSKILSFQIFSLLILPIVLLFLFLIFGRGPGQIPRPIGISYVFYGFVISGLSIHNAIRLKRKKEILNFIPSLF